MTLRCPNCEDKPLNPISLPMGLLERCDSCLTLFVPWGLLARLSEDPARFLTQINGLLSFRLPSGRNCPRCDVPLEQGRMPGSGVILTVCAQCHSVLTDVATLREHDPRLADALNAEIKGPDTELPQAFGAVSPADETAPAEPMAPPQELWADRLAEEINKVRETFEKTLSETQRTNTELEAKLREQESQIQELKTRLETAGKQWALLNDSLAKRERDLEAHYAEEMKKTQRIVDEKVREKLSETADALARKNAEQEKQIHELRSELDKVRGAQENALQEKLKSREIDHIRQLETLHRQVLELTQKLATAEKQAAEKTVMQPAVPLPTPAATSAYEPKPSPVPALTPAPSKTVSWPPVTKPAPASASILPPEPKKPSFLSGMIAQAKAAWTPPPRKPKAAAPQPAPAPTPEPAPAPPPKAEPAPAVKTGFTPAPVIRSSKTAKRDWIGLLVGWGPRVLPLPLFFIVNALSLREPAYALGWGMIIGCGLYMLRLRRMYPARDFPEMSVSQLADLPNVGPWQGAAVSLQGQLIAGDPGKKELYFEDATGRVPLNQLGRLEFLPRLFGMAVSPGVMPGVCTLTGWARNPGSIFVESRRIQSDAKQRVSMVKSVRWIAVLFLVLLSLALLFSGEFAT
jgi:hypothetical protein